MTRPRPPGAARGAARRTARVAGWPVAGALAAAALAVALAALAGARPEPPAFEAVRDGWRPSDAAVLDRHGALLEERRVDPAGRRLAWVPLEAVSPALVRAVLAAEDRRFWSHGGVDARALLGALRAWLAGGPPRGGSTVSMQVAALVDPALARPGARRTLAGKWRQVRLARALEARWPKARILEAYLNLAAFRGEVQGVGAAARLLLGRAPHGVDDAEAAVLAALLRGPNAAEPAVLRRALAVAAAAGPAPPAGLVAAAAGRALGSPPLAAPAAAGDAPHLAAWLLAAGPAPPAASPAVVRTTLDRDLQRHAAASLRRHLLAIRDRSARDGAVLVADNATGEVLAYVGGPGDLASRRFVDGVRAHRQAGSTLKPFLYGLAFETRLLTPASRLEDAPLEVPAGSGLYRPRNYDAAFLGPVTAATALAASLNVPAVRTIGLVGPDAFADRLRALGFGRLTEAGDYYGPALALGSADVSLWELVGAYRALAAGGTWSPLRVRPAGAAGAGPETPAARRVFPAAVAFLVADVLAGREARSPTFGLESVLGTRSWAAVKTGTSKDMRDNWAVGFSRRYTVGVWVGNFSGAPMRDVSGTTGAAPVWRDVMAWLHRDAPEAAPALPPGVVRAAGAWLLAGTEPPVPGPAPPARARPARLLAPAPGTVVALDPDVPPGRQRVAFEADAAGAGLRYALDGADLGPAAGPLLWAPQPGLHRLALVDAEARVVDAVEFEVRGRGPAAGSP